MKKPLASPAGFGPPQFVGTTVVGERGQVVIPKDVRNNLDLKAGSRLVVLQHPKGGIIMLPVEHVRGIMDEMARQFGQIQKFIKK